MKKHSTCYHHLLWGAFLITTITMLSGCATHPPAWNISITKTTPSSIQVDLIGINSFEKASWEDYDLDKYWSAGNRRRAEANKITKTLELGQKWVFSQKNPKWKEWFDQGKTELLIIANLPGSFEKGPGDPRRLIIPLDKHDWLAKDHTIEIQVQDTQIQVLTPRKYR